MFAVLLWSAVSFVCGSLPFSVWSSRLIAHADIHCYGDGNPGAVNAWRAGGWRAGIPAMLLDFLKGAVPVGWAHFQAELTGWALVPVALAPVFGHAFSPFLRFGGGKAIAATFGIWSGLTLWAGPTVLGLALSAAMAVNSADAGSVVFGMGVLLVYLLFSGSPAALLAVWAGNFALLLWKQRHDLRTPLRLRPWLLRLLEKVC